MPDLHDVNLRPPALLKPMTLQEILITTELNARRSRQPNVFAERRGLNTIARRAPYGRRAVLLTICEQALELCVAESAGVSILVASDNARRFSWDTLLGRLAPFAGGSAPFDHSPCGVCLKLGAAQLFRRPERYFRWMQEAGMTFSELLVVPMYQDSHTPLGAIWIVSHDNERTFDSEDVRIMTALAAHTVAALAVAPSS